MIRLLLVLFFLGGAMVASANQEIQSNVSYITGNGSYSGFCDGSPGSYFCVDQIKSLAQREAMNDAEWTCEMRNGTVDTFSATCSDFCTPNYIPPDSVQQFVTCRSNCSIRCTIPSRTVEIQE